MKTLDEVKEFFNEKNYNNIDLGNIKLVDSDPFDESKFHIANSYVAYKNHTFYRFNEAEIDKVKPSSKDVPWLATHSAGIQLQFYTNSPLIRVVCRNNDSFSMKNMSFMGMCGFDSYVYDEKYDKFLFHRSTYPLYIDDKKYIGNVGEFNTREMRKIVVNFPLYAGVLDLVIQTEEGSIIKPWKFENEKKIVCYGTSIMQGCSSSHPGICTTNKMSRYFRQEVVNYGFSGAALLEKEVAEIIASRDNIEMLFIDAEANAGFRTALYENFEQFVDIIFKNHPQIPIIIMNRLKSTYDAEMTLKWHEFNDEVMKEVVEKYKKNGFNIRFVDNWSLYPDDETDFTVEGLHPTDYGMNILTDQYIKITEQIKEENK